LPGRSYTAGEIDAAIARLQDPDRFAHASALVSDAAPSLARVLDEALAQGGWYGPAHEQQLLAAASQTEPDERLDAIRTLVSEQTRVGMLVGVAVGFELARELSKQSDPSTDERS
jgi:hypothetical protein